MPLFIYDQATSHSLEKKTKKKHFSVYLGSYSLFCFILFIHCYSLLCLIHG